MANPVTSGFKRAPRWAWYVVAGVGLGGAAIQLYRRRGERTEALQGEIVEGDANGQYVGNNPSPMPGIVVPPVIIPQQQTDQFAGVLPLQELYIGAVGDIIQGWQDVAGGWREVYDPIMGQNQQLIDLLGGSFQQSNEAILSIATAGGSPSATPSPVAAQPQAPQVAAPAPTCPPNFPNGTPGNCYAQCGHDECHCEGSGKNRKCWTRREHAHCRQNGQRVVVSFDKIRDGC